MELQTKILRSQLSLMKPFTAGCSLETLRHGQDKLGMLMADIHRSDVNFNDEMLGGVPCSMVMPKDETSCGIILYLHGGGYTCGDLEYAKGFGAVLAAKCGIRVFCAAYRLAPETVFPGAVEDSLIAYRHLLELGYDSSQIVLCGESAGGGLLFSLCYRLKSLKMALPAGCVAISPWTDLTMSGESFAANKTVDPSLTRERLEYFADCYLYGEAKVTMNEEEDKKKRTDPLVSPLFGKPNGFPPALIFVGGDEILLDDARLMHGKLLKHRCRSQLITRPDMWHAYVLYCLKENADDFDRIRQFLVSVGLPQKKLRWMRLDNAAKIYPAAKTRRWSNFFRLSATLTEPVDRTVLASALDITVRRFPSIAVRLRRGVFWYYFEEIPKPPRIQDEKPYPLYRVPFDDIRKCAFRVLVYQNRVAVEFFHAITDGNGGIIFLKTLLAEYLSEKYGIAIPTENGILNRLQQPQPDELEDSFQKYGGPVEAGRREATAYHLDGTPEKDGFCTNSTLLLRADDFIAAAGRYGVTVTAFLAATMMKAVLADEISRVPNPRRRKPVKVLIPVNLRRLFPSRTLRNFVLFTTPSADARLGDYSLDELCRLVKHHMGLNITDKQMSAVIAKNVGSERHPLLKIMPLFIKNIAMKAVYNMVGEKKSCFSSSNLGRVSVPAEMEAYINRMDFVLGVQSRSPYNVGILTYRDTMYINFIRNIKEPYLEYRFYEVLRDLGIKVKVESNQRS